MIFNIDEYQVLQLNSAFVIDRTTFNQWISGKIYFIFEEKVFCTNDEAIAKYGKDFLERIETEEISFSNFLKGKKCFTSYEIFTQTFDGIAVTFFDNSTEKVIIGFQVMPL